MKSKHKIIITLASFVVCSVIFLGVLVYPIFRGVLKDHEKVLAHKRKILQLQEDTKDSRDFEMLAGVYAKEFLQLERVFVDSKTPIAFFRFLDETASLFSLQIEKAPGSVKQLEGDHWPSFDVRVAGKGFYPHVMAFLQRIENSPYLLEVETLAISTRKGFSNTESRAEVEFSLALKVFTK